jgi:formylglycine-generating enzyme required for sulfatase activity
MIDNPSRFKRNQNNPVENINWKIVQEFIAKFNQLEHIRWKNLQDFCEKSKYPIPYIKARLPSEAQWEYACRAGTKSAFCFGNKILLKNINYDASYPYAGGKVGRCRGKPVQVKSLTPNSWGLYEMHGNVWEWCQDYWVDQLPIVSVIDPNGSDIGIQRVIRGGSWNDGGKEARSANRSSECDYNCSDNIGFRLALSLELKP